MPPDAPLATDPDDGRGRPGRPGLRRPHQVRRARSTTAGEADAWRPTRAGRSSRTATAGGGWCPRPSRGTSSRSGRSAGSSSTTSCVICAGGGGVPTMFPSSAPDDPGRGRGGHRQGLRQRAAGPRDRGRPVRDGHRRRRGLRATGGRPQQRALAQGDRVASCAQLHVPGRVDGTQGRGGLPIRRGHRGTRRRSAHSRTSSRSSTAQQAPRSPPRDLGPERNGGDMAQFGVHSEVGTLRKVMVHRPELSLQRLTPTNHDDLLFDDVLWVERAQYEHDQFVAKMRDRGVEVYLLRDLLGETLAASEEAGAGWSSSPHRSSRSASPWSTRCGPCCWEMQPEQLARHLIGGLTVAESGLDLGRLRSRSVIAAAIDDESMFVLPPLPEHAVHPRLVVLDLRRGVDQPDVLAGPPARGVQRRRDLPLPPDVRRGRLRLLVPDRWVTTTSSRPRTSVVRRWRAATCSRSATARS